MDLGFAPRPEEGIANSALAPVGPLFSPFDVNVTSSSQHEVEPAVITTTLGGTVYTVSTYARLDNYYTLYSTRLNETNGTRTLPGQLPILSDYHSYGDPSLDANVYGGGVSQGRIYNVGIMHNGYGSAKTAIGCWHSDDGGATWSSPTIVASDPTAAYFHDRPTVIVSPAANSLGWIYVIYSRITIGPPTSFQLFVALSTNGGAGFGASHPVDSRRDGGQQILVAPNTGNVLAIWIDYDAEQMKMAQSSDFGTTWQTPEIVTTATHFFIEGTLFGGIRAVSAPWARFNRPNNRVAVVWHESRDGTSKTDCFYTSKTTSGWQAKVRVNDSQVNDQFMPSLERLTRPATTGSWLSMIAVLTHPATRITFTPRTST